MKVITGLVPLAAFFASSANAFLLTPFANTARSYSRVSLLADLTPTEIDATRHFTIPLEHLSLVDIPKVGGYVSQPDPTASQIKTNASCLMTVRFIQQICLSWRDDSGAHTSWR
jgi:hypothetical protein